MTKKKKEVRKEKPVETINAKVLINVFSPGHDPTEFRINIPNIVGSANLLHRSPESIAAAVISGLRAKYGERVA